MGDREEYLETPLLLPPSLYGPSLARSLARSYADVIAELQRAKRASEAPWVRKIGNPSSRENLVIDAGLVKLRPKNEP